MECPALQLEQAHLLDTFGAIFDEYWDDPAFEPYDPARDARPARQALAAEAAGRPTCRSISPASTSGRIGYQQEILDELRRRAGGARPPAQPRRDGDRHGQDRRRGLDYRRLREAGKVDSLLFVAHQERDPDAEPGRVPACPARRDVRRAVRGRRAADEWRHVFASIQSLPARPATELDPDRFDMVIVDEFHHAEARTYAPPASTTSRHVLLGLTATPERADGQDVLRWFGGRTAVELRLWEALERQLLAPFQYFGVHDDVDLSAHCAGSAAKATTRGAGQPLHRPPTRGLA